MNQDISCVERPHFDALKVVLKNKVLGNGAVLVVIYMQ